MSYLCPCSECRAVRRFYARQESNIESRQNNSADRELSALRRLAEAVGDGIDCGLAMTTATTKAHEAWKACK